MMLANNSSNSDEDDVGLIEYELVDKKSRAEKLGLSPIILETHSKVGIIFKEICGNHERDFWYTNTEDARLLGIDETSPICDPFKEELNPNAETLAQLAALLNELIHNKTKPGNFEKFMNLTETEDSSEETDSKVEVATNDPLQKVILRVKRKIEASTEEEAARGVEDKWLEDITFESREILTINKKLLDKLEQENSTIPMDSAWIQIDATDEASPLMYIYSEEASKALNLNITSHHFHRYEKIVLYLPGICSDFVPTAIDSFNASDFEGIEIDGPIGVNITALELSGVNLTELAEKLRNDTEVDDILSRTNGSMRTLGGSFILPVLQKNQYDPFSAPIVFQGSAVAVRFGIYIESMSNFQTSTMDYDMDISLLMAWRDARLVNPYDKPILVKEEEILEKIWRPDPFFANAKEAEFHEVTFLNFLMRIFNDGLVLYETRVKLKPACNLILCKYPHDKQTCDLQIKSFAYPIETVRFEWFTRKNDAIDKNPDVKLPELYIDRYEPSICNRTRKSGDFSCLRAVFRLKRDVGFHIAQTYIPTSLALMFSWVGVWLPEEFMEGRIGVAITVLLTLSTESAGAREHLPSVSYLKVSSGGM
uniref:Neurotransmitter-gated ion-channel ligand-binding domain-containing protein n=1 Tax=Panagrolaimus sp. JU765 TaxID=591449 RepID=A0AC34RN54_9BILA